MPADTNRKTISPRLAGDLMLVAISSVWGANLPLMKYLLLELSSPGVAALRFGFTALLLGPVLYVRREKMSWSLVKGGIMCGIPLVTMMIVSLFALERTSATRTNFLMSLFMMVVPVFAYIFYRRKPASSLIMAIFVATIGVYCLTMNDPTQNLPINIGDGLAFLAAILNALHIIAVGHFGMKYDVHCIASIQMIFTGICSVIWAMATGNFSLDISMQAWIALLVLVLICTIFAYGGQLWGQARTSAERAAVIMCLYPLTGTLVAAMLLGERMGIWGAIGSALITIAVVLTVCKPKSGKTAYLQAEGV